VSNNFNEIFKKFQGAQRIIADLQSELKAKRIEALSGGGLVKVVVDGNQDIVAVHIDKEVFQMKDARLLEDLIKSAVNEAKHKAQEEAQNLMRKVAGFSLNDLKTLLSNKEKK